MVLNNIFGTTFKKLDFIKSFFILLLAVSGNFVGETLSCQTRRLLGNMIAKDVLIFALLYFGLDLMDDESNHPHPIERLKQTFFVWLFYSMFTRMTIVPTIVAFILLCLYYLVLDLIEYHKNNDNEEYAEKLEYINKNIMKTSIGVVTVGFILYFLKQKNDYGNKFNFFTFFKGVIKCKNN